MTQKQLAALAGISERLVRSIECGEARGIGLDKLLSVLAQLGLGLELCESPHAENGDSRDSAYDDLLHKAAVSWGYGE